LRDSFTFTSIDSEIEGLIHGGSGSDSLVLQINKDTVIELGTDITSNLNLTAVETISANSSATNTLITDDVDSVWLIDKSRGGSLAYGDANVSFTNIDNIYGGNKKDTITVSTGNSANGVSLIDMGDGNDSFIGISGRVADLYAGSGNDNISLTDVSIQGLINGGDDIDSIIFNNQVSVTIGEDFSYFESLISATDTGTINAQNGAKSDWTITSLNAGFVTDSQSQQTALTFSGFSTINGSDGVDTFFVQENGALTNVINGNGGEDTLNIELDELRNINDSLLRFDGGDGADIVSINGVSAQYSENYNANVNYNNEQFDQLSYDRNGEASIAIYYRDVAVVNDDIATTSLTLNSIDNDSLMLEQGQFSNNLAAIAVAMNSENKGNIIVQATESSDIIFADSFVVNGELSLFGGSVSQQQGIVQADSLTVNNVDLLGSEEKSLSVDIDEVNVSSHSGNIYLNDINDVNLGSMSDVTGNILLTSSTGNISTSSAISSSGNFALAAAQAINLTDDNSFSGVLSLTAGTAINLVNNGVTTIGQLSANELDIKSSGSLNATGDFIVENASIESSVGDINLTGNTEVNNLIVNANGAVSLSGKAALNNATLTSSNAITLENITADTLTLAANDDINLATINANALTATSSNGSILSTEALTIGASAIDNTSLTLIASNGDVSLTNDNNDFGQITIDAQNAEITDVKSVSILGSEVVVDLNLIAGGDVLK
jgi:hypothetical protein